MPTTTPAVLAGLGPVAWAELCELGHVVSYPAGETILLQGSPSEAMLLLEDGLTAVSVSDALGQDVFLAFRGAGDLVGEFGCLDGRPRSATVRAVAPTRCRVFHRSPLDRFLARRPEAYRAVTNAVIDKMRRATDRRIRYAQGRLGDRVGWVLLDHAAEFGRAGDVGVIVIDVPLSQVRIADLVRARPRIVGQQLAALVRAGAIDTGYRSSPRRLKILDQDLLRRRLVQPEGSDVAPVPYPSR
ncbi:Crp/Fnr family transcriptional regulator [Pseudonocardia bannensis]|uniref:Crp/Fnr family transcriptional regulator n=1 Tax=Pseudonocardia bannensis TaxID=630973 RepID=A0A848DBJ9_9PSEU|nr:Crp/Fnr family transcriptional regulator [Pseudonocardia bannensis]NMH90180.1 Crp/Fnr family transcriptional regulator [Pseudonocardia bannensis]